MKAADNRFKNHKQKKIWNVTAEEEEKILALQNELKAIKRSASKKGNITPKKGANRSQRVSKKKTTERDPEAKPKWFYKEPKADDIFKPRQWKGNDSYWWGTAFSGKCDGCYCCHKANKCEGNAHKFNPRKRITSEDGRSSSRAKKMKLAKVLQATIDKEGTSSHGTLSEDNSDS